MHTYWISEPRIERFRSLNRGCDPPRRVRALPARRGLRAVVCLLCRRAWHRCYGAFVHRQKGRPLVLELSLGSGFLFFYELAIAHRPEVLADSNQYGHVECDLVKFRKELCRAKVTSLVKRVIRFAAGVKNSNRL